MPLQRRGCYRATLRCPVCCIIAAAADLPRGLGMEDFRLCPIAGIDANSRRRGSGPKHQLREPQSRANG